MGGGGRGLTALALVVLVVTASVGVGAQSTGDGSIGNQSAGNESTEHGPHWDDGDEGDDEPTALNRSSLAFRVDAYRAVPTEPPNRTKRGWGNRFGGDGFGDRRGIHDSDERRGDDRWAGRGDDPGPRNGDDDRDRHGPWSDRRENRSYGDRLRMALNGTFEGHVDANRTTEAPFRTDAFVAASTRWNEPNVGEDLAASDAVLARTAIEDAERVADRLENRSVDYDEPRVERSLEHAREAFDRGRRIEGRSPTGAIFQYSLAWHRAQFALRSMDGAAAPNVTLASRADPVRNGSGNYTFRGRMVAVQPTKVNVSVSVDGRNVSVVTDGQTAPGEPLRFAARVPLDAPPNEITVTAASETDGPWWTRERDARTRHDDRRGREGGRWGQADDLWRGDDRSDRGRDRSPRSDDRRGPDDDRFGDDDRGQWSGPSEDDARDDRSWGGPPDRGEWNHSDEPRDWSWPGERDDRWADDRDWREDDQDRRGRDDDRTDTTTVTLRLDGDGLPDTYEENVTGTDPLDRDSDSNRTDADEAGNDVIDGREDFDGDGLTTIDERDRGTDPLDADTDVDGLEDRFEVVVTGTDPLSADSDGDGFDDGAEDLDGDGLTNAEEVDVSDPTLADSDGDGLNDSTELDLGTDPLDTDTDGDGLSDGTELEPAFGTDPLDPDTDDDGVEDGNETYTTSTTNEGLNATISLTGEGNVAAGAEVSRDRHARFTDSRAPTDVTASPPVHVDVDRPFEEATVEIGYDESAVATNESSLGVYRVNETDGGFYRLPSTVDAANDTVRATTSEFSTVVVLDAEAATEVARERQALRSPGGGPAGVGESIVYDFETDESITLQSGENATVNGDRWRCRNQPRSEPYSDTPTSGYCEFREGAAYIEEETNRIRFLEHTLTLPEVDEGEALFVSANLTAHIDAEWSNAGLGLRVEGDGGEELNVFRVEQDAGGSSHTVDATPRMNVTEYAGEEVTVSLLGDGRWTYEFQSTLAWIEVRELAFETRSGADVDSDGDGISDAWEAAGVPLAETNHTVKLDPNDPDTDGDGKLDGEEVDMDDFRAEQDFSDDDVIHFPGFAWSSDPNDDDTDGDGLADEVERDGWNVSVVNRTDGTYPNPYRFNASGEVGQNETTGTVRFTSDPLVPDTDGDGLNDSVEKEETFTDPRSEVTYGITEEHQEEIVDGVADVRSSGEVRAMGIPSSEELDDASDDFDFVRADDGSVVFTALDRNERTDTWLSNEEEVAEGTDAWDPDTDDDGLTDGQEVKWLTRAEELETGMGPGPSVTRYVVRRGEALGTNASTPDTDGDGYWDGWIGVHGVGRTDNIVLYMENLNDGDGIQGDEVVPEQAGIHPASDSPSPMGAELPEYDEKMHSNLHIGELQWGTEPTERNDEPSPNLSIEADFYEEAAIEELNDESWERGIEENYALYGIDVDLVRDEVLTDADFVPCIGTVTPPACTTPNAFGALELIGVESRHHDTVSDEYLLIAHQAEGILIPDAPTQTGVNIPGSPAQAIFTDASMSAANNVPEESVQRSPYGSGITMVTAKTEIHEIGHSFSAGEADDDFLRSPTRMGEVYSGSGADDTPEELRGFVGWSVMRAGWNGQLTMEPRNGSYFAYSIEEASTMEE